MPKSPDLLFVIADGEYVRFVRPADDNSLHGAAIVESFSAHKRSANLGSDQSDATCHVGSSAHHAVSPRHDMHVLEKDKFAATVAQWLNAAAATEGFDELVIVAPPHTLAAIRENLNTATNASIVGTLPKDLVKVPDHELWPHLRWWIRPTHRASS